MYSEVTYNTGIDFIIDDDDDDDDNYKFSDGYSNSVACEL